MKRKILATFTKENSPTGFRAGQEYRLYISHDNNLGWHIEGVYSSCGKYYDTVTQSLEEWENIKWL